MTRYVDRVERNLKGCDAVSTGICGGCDECRQADDDYCVSEDDDAGTWTFKASEEGAAYSTEEEAETAARQAFRDAEHDSDDGSFSWCSCGICNSSLGGTREVWHYVDAEGTIRHNDDACTDCVAYLANGDIPDEWLDYCDGESGRPIVRLRYGPVVDDAPRQGSFDDHAAQYVDDTANVDWTYKGANRLTEFLKRYGAWEDLETADLDTLRKRALWIAVLDVLENPDQY